MYHKLTNLAGICQIWTYYTDSMAVWQKFDA